MAQAPGGLFSDYFLTQGVKAAADWNAIAEPALADARARISALLDDFRSRHAPSEANTERDLIDKLLRLLGWHFSVQEKTSRKGRTDVPDYLLFPDAETKANAAREVVTADRYGHGASVVEAKAWEVNLDKAGNEIGEGAPSTQILRYLGNVEVQSNGAIRFGILTNGRVWRLYDNKARSRLEGFVEIDLFEAAGLIVPAEQPPEGVNHADHVLRLFLWLFGREAFVADAGGATRLSRAIADSRRFEARVTDALADTVFEKVFPELANALANADPQKPDTITAAYRAELREAALTWLYRLLFVLYAEDRSLLPTRARRDGLWAARKEVARAIDGNRGLSRQRTNHDGDLRALWRQIDVGDEAIRLPPYNGGLFKPDRSALLDRSLMSDADFAPLLDALSRERIGDAPRFINYRDLSVQHLGSVYERLLEFDLVENGGEIVARPQTFARKTSGSYYTPEELVMLVIRRTVKPLLDQKRAAFAEASERLRGAPGSKPEPAGELERFDPANGFLELKICDPAMGSGHFLVSLVDYLADEVLKATEEARQTADWTDYASPLLARLETIRERIRGEAAAHAWTIDEAQLVDRLLIRRIILKRVIHGVDKNPMAVELAKLSLWLHTFTVGAPLSFLDHHLRCGDSLFGEWVRPALDRFAQVGLFKSQAVKQAELAIGEMQEIEALTDADITEVRQSAETFEAVKADTAELRKLLSVLQGFRWIGESTERALKEARGLRRDADRLALADPQGSLAKSRQAERLTKRAMALEALLEGEFGDPGAAIDMCYGRIGDPDPARAQIAEALAVAAEANFLHWQIAFPGVWRAWESDGLHGGFDAVIGNPPWDRLKMQEVEWFSARKPEIAYATRAADRKRMIGDLCDQGDPLADDYGKASRFASMAARMAGLPPRKGGQYPLLGGGDVNLYSLFVERAARLVKPGGLVGLLVPSGISGDLGASGFFRSISTTGRLGSLLDYANKPVPGGPMFFDDVDSRFKFSAITFGGERRTFAAANCGFFLTATDDTRLAAQTFPLTPADFAAVNPNSGTAPIFRSARDADLVTAIYARIPVLVDHRLAEGDRPWRVRYLRMFDMTNDSELFWTAAELKAEGWYPVAGGRWRKGKAEAAPLYVGRMFHQFDHRAASVEVNEENLHNPAVSDPSSAAEKADPDFAPSPQFFIRWDDVSPQRKWYLGFRDIARPTDVRTMISAILPAAGFGNKAPLLLTDDAAAAGLLAGNLNAFALDFVARNKIQSTSANLYIVEQLPILPPAIYDRRFGVATAREIVAREVLHLTYTAHDMAPFARDMGHVDRAGAVLPPFIWDEAERRQRRARLDALYFHLYGISKEDAHYILSTFPIVRRHDEAEFGGRFVTRDLILHQMDALAAGDAEAVVEIR
ncbi:MAG: hypothetical protein QOD42_2746 [Sphingomonadales bacterium]|jgi:hypothetical protein|nr:hypothetical protein [Sphingomonadales bacterium]